MKMRQALIIVGGATVFLGLTNFATSGLQEQVSTCETKLNGTILLNLTKIGESNETAIQIVERSLTRRIDRFAGIPVSEVDNQFIELGNKMRRSNEEMMQLNERMREILEVGCAEQRQQWYILSFLVILINSLTACVAFWLGLAVVKENS